VTWQLTGTNNESLVKERYWVTFRPGEIRTCANCHGINATDQVGQPPPSNPPQALRELLRYWRTNAASAHQLTVINGSGQGAYGAGSILNLSANPPASGQRFAQWIGPGLSNSASPSTSFIMPGGDAVVTATYSNLPPPNIFLLTTAGANQLQLQIQAQGEATQSYVLQNSSNLVSWVNLSTNATDASGQFLWSVPVNPTAPRQFYRLTFP
jgi:hypothetical protein